MWHIYSDMSIHFVWHSFWHIFWHSFWTSQSRSGSAHWDLELAIRSGSAHWKSRDPHQVGKNPNHLQHQSICSMQYASQFPHCLDFSETNWQNLCRPKSECLSNSWQVWSKEKRVPIIPSRPVLWLRYVEGVSASPEIDGDWDHRVGETDESVVYPWIQFKDI